MKVLTTKTISLMVCFGLLAVYCSGPCFCYRNDNIQYSGARFTSLQKCPWLPACYCKDESKYTNGTYKLLVNCTHANLFEIPVNIPPNTTVLTLDGNHIQDIPPGSFQNMSELLYLDLADNLIESLHADSFRGLGSLKTLELSGNKIRYHPSTIPPEVFKSSPKLQRLNLHQNLSDVDVKEFYPSDVFPYIKNLRQLLIDGLQNQTLGSGFSKLTALRLIDFQSEFHRCKISTIRHGMFGNVSSINILTLRNCSINQIERGSFRELQSLKILDLSHNERLEFKSLPNISTGLQNIHLKELRLNKIHETFGDCTRLTAEHLENFRNMTIDDIYMNSNRLAYIMEDAVEHIPKNIQKLSLTNNMLLAGGYLKKIFDGSVFSRLKYLTLSEQNSNHDILQTTNTLTIQYLKSKIFMVSNALVGVNGTEIGENVTNNAKTNKGRDEEGFCANCHRHGKTYDKIFYVPSSLDNVDFSGLRIRNELKNICICEPNNITRLKLQRNIFWNWQGPIAGLSNLLNLDLSWNSCNNMSVDVFDQMANLTELNLTQNFIERFLREDREGRIFRELKQLQTLLLAGILLTYLPPKIFSALDNLHGIDLSFNFLIQLDITFSPSANLQYLDLMENLLTKVSPSVSAKLDEIDKKKIFHHVYLDLSGNRLTCKCEDVEFVRWISQTGVFLINFDTLTCSFLNGENRQLTEVQEIVQQLEKDCKNYTFLIVLSITGVFLFLIVILAGVVYRYRWDLRYMYYSVKLRVIANSNRHQLIRNEEAEFLYDAFISYASEKGKFVKEKLVPALEQDRSLGLLVHDRDFRAGEFVSDNIMEAITSSRRTLILMDKHFLKSRWCIFEMNMARMEAIKTGRNVLCLIMMETVDPSGLPLEIMDIIRKQTYLEIPQEEAHMEMFWDRVHSALK